MIPIVFEMYKLFFLFDFRSNAKELADWLISNNVVEHIFGPNLHIEVCGLLYDLSALLREKVFKN